jgi:RHS repeat-associated protein
LQGSGGTPYGFTGEVEVQDGGGLYDLRARRYAPGLGVFASRDSFEGVSEQAMSLNGYSWVEGTVVNVIDRSGDRPCEGAYGCDENELFFEELYGLNTSLLNYGSSLISQNRCNGPYYSPFGCDGQGNPIPYLLI